MIQKMVLEMDTMKNEFELSFGETKAETDITIVTKVLLSSEVILPICMKHFSGF